MLPWAIAAYLLKHDDRTTLARPEFTRATGVTGEEAEAMTASGSGSPAGSSTTQLYLV